MVVLNRIYTRTGDDGTTALGSGARRKKYDLRVSAYGTLDEVNAVIGIVRLHTAGDASLGASLSRIQNDLFDVEADLCLSERGPGGARLTVTDAQVDWIEGEIDRLNAELAPLRSFVLPGGSPAAAYLHLARTICRRAERIMVELKDKPGETVTWLPQIRQSPFRFPVRRKPLCQRQRRTRCALGAGTESLDQPRHAKHQRKIRMVMPLWDENPFTKPSKPWVTWGSSPSTSSFLPCKCHTATRKRPLSKPMR
jgi:cob(I)alamin adenosyltransferase